MNKILISIMMLLVLFASVYIVCACCPCRYDINKDGEIDMADVGIAARAFGSYPGHSRWNATADINYDLEVNMRDLGVICSHFGDKC